MIADRLQRANCLQSLSARSVVHQQGSKVGRCFCDGIYKVWQLAKKENSGVRFAVLIGASLVEKKLPLK